MFGSGGTGFGGFGQQNQQNQQAAQPGQTGGLFGAPQQPAAGSGFGGFGAQPSSTFGASTNAGGSLFGQPAQPQQQAQPSSGFTFGQANNNATSTPFGQQNQPKPAGFGGFGASTSTAPSAAGGFGGFGATQNNQTQPSPSPFGGGGAAFGAKPAGSLFGQQQPQQTSFGQPAQTGGLFGGVGASQTAPMPTQGTSNPPYDLKPQPEGPPDTPYDEVKKMPQLLNYTSITCMKPYRAASLEELRLQDYEQGRKSGNGGVGVGFGQSTNTGGFGAPAQPGGLFGQPQQQPQQQQTGFGASGGMFGQTNQQQPGQATGGLFGSTSNTGGGGLFGQQQPQTGGLFGQSQNTQQSTAGGFGFGAPQQQQQQNPSSGFTFGQNNAQQQNKPAGSLFGGGFGSAAQAPGTASGFTFGGANNPSQQQQQQPATSGFGGTSGGGFGFGATTANANQPKPGGLFGAPATSTPSFGGFGATSSAPGVTDNKSAPFSFGGGGFGSSAPGQASTAAPAGGLFGNSQPTTTSQPTSGFTFGGAAGATNNATGASGGLFGGQQQNQQATSGFGGASGGLFGAKPATGGLFGAQQPQQQQQQQPSTGAFGFGAQNNAAGNTGGGLFGNNAQNKPAGGGLFGGLGTGTNQQQAPGGGLFGNTTLGGGATGGGLFGSSQPGQLGGGGLFGSNNQQASSTNTGAGLFGSSTLGGSTGGFGLGGQNNNQQSLGSSLFGNSQQNQQAPNIQVSLNSNPYGTDALFGGQANSANGSSGLSLNANNGLNNQPHLPFNVSLSRSSSKKQPPLVPPFRSSSRNSIRITKLRGSTPNGTFRESTPGREGTPGASLFSSSPAPSSYQRLTSPSPSIFRGLSDDVPRSQRESSVSTTLPSQAFVSRPSVKRLVLDDSRNSTTGFSRSGSLFTIRGSTPARDSSPATGTPAASTSAFERNGTPARSHVNFSPALETAASSRLTNGRIGEADSTFNSTSFAGASHRGGMEESPSKKPAHGEGGADSSLPSLSRSMEKQVKEDALLPLDYYTSPPLSELRDWSHSELQAVEGFVVGRKGFGYVSFDAPVDLTTVGELGIIPGGIVILRAKECIVYPDEEECLDLNTGKERDGVQPGFEPRKIPGGKAEQGTGLNVPAVIRLEKCWTFDRSTRLPVKDEDHIRYKQHINKLKRRGDAHFIDFEAETGIWTFRVDHFSRYGLDETDEDTTDDEMADRDGKAKAKRNEKLPQRDDKGDEDDDDDDIPPPARALGEISDDEQSGAESEMRASELGSENHTPRRVDRGGTPKASAQSYSRGSTPLSNTNRGSAAPSNVGSQPWAASLGLEARRVQVMQASFFGGNKEVVSTSPALGRGVAGGVKQTRMASPSFVSSNVGNVASRSSFLNPLSSEATPEVMMSNNQSNINTSNVVNNENLGATLSISNATVRPRKFSRLELTSSVVEGGHGIVIDAGLSMGRSFRLGWGPDGTFVHSGKWTSPGGGEGVATSKEAVVESFSAVKVGKINVFPKNDESKKEREVIKELLQVQLKQSIIEDDEDGNDCPAIYPMPTLRFQDFVKAFEGVNESRYETAIFKLGVALFDEVETKLNPEMDYPSDFRDQVEKIRRKNNVANWIRWYVGDSIRSEIRSQLASTGKHAGEQNVFTYLSGGYFEEACKQAIDSGDVRLATLIAQATSGGDEEEFRLDLLDQLSVWRSSGADVFIASEYRRIFELLSGNVTWSKGNGKREESEAVKDLQIASGLGWVRTFSLFLHFDSTFEMGLTEAVDRYESNIGGEADIVPPLPPHLEKEIRPGSQRFRQAIRTGKYNQDVLFHLLKLFCNPSYELENALQPLCYGENQLNYSIAFHLSLLFSKVLLDQSNVSSGGRDFNDRIELGIDNYDLAQEVNLKGNSGKSDRLCLDFAMQLETMNLWTWAAFVLLHLELRQSRTDNVKALLARNVDLLTLRADATTSTSTTTPTTTDEDFLVNTLKIPIEWLYEAKADRASSKEDRWKEFQYLLLAKHYSRAHEIAIRFLAPEGIIRHDFEFILSLFAAFQQRTISQPRAARNRNLDDSGSLQDGGNDDGDEEEVTIMVEDVSLDVPGWTRGGQIYLDYIAICRSLPWLISNYGKSHSSRLPPFSNNNNPPTNHNLIEKDEGGLVKIERMANKIPKLMSDVRNLFEGFQETVSMTVAQSQMITSLYTCIRMLKSSPLVKQFNLNLSLDDINTLEETTTHPGDKGSQVPVEIENLQFFANDYCSMLIGTA